LGLVIANIVELRTETNNRKKGVYNSLGVKGSYDHLLISRATENCGEPEPEKPPEREARSAR
jgi:hypothetical protein